MQETPGLRKKTPQRGPSGTPVLVRPGRHGTRTGVRHVRCSRSRRLTRTLWLLPRPAMVVAWSCQAGGSGTREKETGSGHNLDKEPQGWGGLAGRVGEGAVRGR